MAAGRAIVIAAGNVSAEAQLNESKTATAIRDALPIGVLTADRDGALLFVNGDRYEVRPRPATETDPTGAGDVFAATFLVEYQRSGDPWLAAAAAACAGSISVEGEGWVAVPDRGLLEATLKEYERSG